MKKNKKKKILLIMDHPGRDLGGMAYLAYQLIVNFGHVPIITGTRNEIRDIIIHRPDLIIMSHLWFPRHVEVVDVAKKLGVDIGILPTEGIADEPNFHQYTYGQDKLREMIDLAFTWSEPIKQYLTDGNHLQNAVIQACGCPRFDFDANKNLKENYDHDLFCKTYGFDPEKPIVFWATGTSHANRESQLDYIWKKRLYLSFRPYEYFQDVYSDSTKVLNHSCKMIGELYENIFKKVNFVIKPHPQEEQSNYDELKRKYPDILFLPHTDSIQKYIHYIDILLHFRCTVSYESWLSDIERPTIHLTSHDIKLTNFKDYIFNGSDIAHNSEELNKLVCGYISGIKVGSEKIEFRQDFIKKYLYASDSNRTKHCAGIIDEFLKDRKKRYGFHIDIVKKAFIVHARRMAGKNIGKYVRDNDHFDYFDKSTFNDLISRFNKSFHTNVKITDYVLGI